MARLEDAAQRLREAIQAMAGAPAGPQRDSAHAMPTQAPGERRNQAIDQVNEALLEVNQAMVQLPWEPGSSARVGGTGGTAVSGGISGSASAFNRMDRNHDGVISRDEFVAHQSWPSAGTESQQSQRQ